MSADVVDLDSRRPHISGYARCMACHHEWVAVAPILEDGSPPLMECPQCGTLKGVFKYPIVRGTQVWTCVCENDLFRFTGNGRAYCPNCGRWQYPPQSDGPQSAA